MLFITKRLARIVVLDLLSLERKMNKISLTLLLLVVPLGALLARAADAVAQPESTISTGGNIVLYDPDANFSAMDDIIAGLNQHFAVRVPGVRVQATHNRETFEATVKNTHAEYVVVASTYLKDVAALPLQPLLVPLLSGNAFYRKVLVDNGQGAPRSLAGRQIATVTTGNRGRGGRNDFLEVLKNDGITSDGAVLIKVSKDIDALLALTFGQVQAALVTQGSINVIKEINPSAAASLRVLWTSGPILRSPLCAVKENESMSRREPMVSAFMTMGQTANGRAAMQTLGFEDWEAFRPAMMEN